MLIADQPGVGLGTRFAGIPGIGPGHLIAEALAAGAATLERTPRSKRLGTPLHCGELSLRRCGALTCVKQ